MTQEESTFLQHIPCESCGSSDANSLYSDGHQYCHSCKAYVAGDVESAAPKTHTKKPTSFVQGDVLPLRARGISQETCKHWQYKVGNDRDGKLCQIANYFFEGELVGQKLRFPDKSFSVVGKLKGFYGQHLWKSGGKRLVVTEGEIDALTVSQLDDCKWPVVSVPNGAGGALKTFEQELEWLSQFEEVVLAFDMDAVGQEAAKACAAVLKVGTAFIAHLPMKDANECLQNGEIAKLKQALWNAKPFRPDGIVSGMDLDINDIRTASVKGYSTPYPEMDEVTGGIRKQELTLLTAGTGIGKSTMAREIGFHFLEKHGLKIANVYLEESVKKTVQGYVAIDNNVPLGKLRANPDILTDAQWDASDQKILKSGNSIFYDHFGSLDSSYLLGKLRFMAVSLKVDFIILDHISIVVSGQESSKEGERKDIDRLMTALRALIEETGVGVIAVAHLVKSGEGKSHEEGGRVTLSDLRGSGSLKQIPDLIIAKERNQQGDNPDVSLARVLKNREHGVTGEAGEHFYDVPTGRLLPHTSVTPEDFESTEFPDDKPPF